MDRRTNDRPPRVRGLRSNGRGGEEDFDHWPFYAQNFILLVSLNSYCNDGFNQVTHLPFHHHHVACHQTHVRTAFVC